MKVFEGKETKSGRINSEEKTAAQRLDRTRHVRLFPEVTYTRKAQADALIRESLEALPISSVGPKR